MVRKNSIFLNSSSLKFQYLYLIYIFISLLLNYPNLKYRSKSIFIGNCILTLSLILSDFIILNPFLPLPTGWSILGLIAITIGIIILISFPAIAFIIARYIYILISNDKKDKVKTFNLQNLITYTWLKESSLVLICFIPVYIGSLSFLYQSLYIIPGKGNLQVALSSFGVAISFLLTIVLITYNSLKRIVSKDNLKIFLLIIAILTLISLLVSYAFIQLAYYQHSAEKMLQADQLTNLSVTVIKSDLKHQYMSTHSIPIKIENTNNNIIYTKISNNSYTLCATYSTDGGSLDQSSYGYFKKGINCKTYNLIDVELTNGE